MYQDMINLPLLRRCLAETLRMYPEPPLLIRRALVDDVLPQGGADKKTFIAKGRCLKPIKPIKPTPNTMLLSF
jgi:cytochrome P450